MLSTRQNVNVYGGPRNSALATRVQKVATMNLKPVVRQKVRLLFISLFTALGFLYAIHKILQVTSSLDLESNKQLVKQSWMAIKGNVNVAIKTLEYLESLRIPQAVYNAAFGAFGSIAANVAQLKRPGAKKAIVTGVVFSAVGSIFPHKASALAELKKIQTSMTRSEKAFGAYLSKSANLIKTGLGFQSQAQEIASLCAILTRYIIKLSLSFGISMSRGLIEKVKFVRSSENAKRLTILGNSDARKLATQVMRTLSAPAPVTQAARALNAPFGNSNAANALLSLSRNRR
jgi:hypothetical protein